MTRHDDEARPPDAPRAAQPDRLRVTLARAEDDRVRSDALELGAGACVGDALRMAVEAGLLPADTLRMLQEGGLAVAVYGRLRRLDHPLRSGDRIELLGPLTVDPKLARQRRVARRRAALARDKWSGAGR